MGGGVLITARMLLLEALTSKKRRQLKKGKPYMAGKIKLV